LHAGYNVRPLELQAAIGLVQLDRLATANETRNRNRDRMLAALQAHPRWDGRFEILEPGPGIAPAWFGLACLLHTEFACSKDQFLQHLTRVGVENRPTTGGNFTRQPGLRRHGIRCCPEDYPGAEAIHHRGFFIGLHTEPLSDSLVATLADVLLTPISEL